MAAILQIRTEHDHPSPDGSSCNRLLRFQAPDGSFFLTSGELAELRHGGQSFEIMREIREADLGIPIVLPHHGAVLDPPPESARLAVLARLLAEDRAEGVHVRFLGRDCTVPADGFVLDRAGGKRRYVWQVIEKDEIAGAERLDERFTELRALCADPTTRVVLSLGSGGLKLFAHAPALRLVDTLGLGEHVDEVWGSSAGAMAGLLYSQGLSPHAIEQMGYDLYTGRVDLALRPSKLQLLRHVVRDTLLGGGGIEAGGFVDCASGMSGLLERYCAPVAPRRPFFAIAFNLLECRSDVLTPGPVPPHLRSFVFETEPREAALASSTVPVLFVPRVLSRDGVEIPYIDGSATEDVPLRSPVEKWDRDREAGVETRAKLVILYVKLTGTLACYRVTNGTVGKLRLVQTVAANGIETMHRRDVEILESRSDVQLLGLELGDSDPDFFEIARIPTFIRDAKESFPRQLLALEMKLRAQNAG